MPRLVYLVLKNGRSVVASCAGETSELLRDVLQRDGASLFLTADDHVDRLRAADVQEYRVVSGSQQLPRFNSVYRLLHV